METLDPDGLRDYQRDAVNAILGQLESHRSTILCMATGMGKTVTFCAIAKHWPGRVLILAHRTELIIQGWHAAHRLTGERIGIEKAQERAHGSRIVFGSVQTLKEHRLTNMEGDPFSLIIIDEAHHSCAKSYRQIMAALPNAKILGVTATPKRGDGVGLHNVFESIANDHPALGKDLNMAWGISEGWLTPIKSIPVHAEIDIDKLKVHSSGPKKGEIDESEMDDAIASCAAELRDAVLRVCGSQKTIVFAPGVKTAHATALALSESEPGSSFAIDGKTDSKVRAGILRRHKNNEFPRLCNCQILVEGFDDPTIIYELIAIFCKSISRVIQMMGRVSRLWPGIDKLATAELRKAAIAASPKPFGIVLDLVGNTKRHDFVSPLDVLGGTATVEVRKRAKKKLIEVGGDIDKAIAAADAEITAEEVAKKKAQTAKESAARAARMRAKLTVEEATDPFRAMGIRNPEKSIRAVRPDDIATSSMKWVLENKYEMPAPDAMTKRQFFALIKAAKKRADAGLCSYKTVKGLAAHGIDARDMSKATRDKLREAFEANGRVMPPKDVVAAIVNVPRDSDKFAAEGKAPF